MVFPYQKRNKQLEHCIADTLARVSSEYIMNMILYCV